MSFGGGKAPRPQTPPAPPTEESPGAKKARADHAKSMQMAKGFSSTIATSGTMNKTGGGQLV